MQVGIAFYRLKSAVECGSQNFVPNNMSANFREFDSTVENYIHFMELWLEYERTLPINLLVMKYEDMVSDFESYVLKVCDFMEKPWDDKILRYYEHKQKRGVRTPTSRCILRQLLNGSHGKIISTRIRKNCCRSWNGSAMSSSLSL